MQELTAQAKNTMEKVMNKSGRLSQPNISRIVRNMISTGMVTMRSVRVVRRGLGSGNFDEFEQEGRPWCRRRAAACKDVDNLEMGIEPAAPGRPVKAAFLRTKIFTKKKKKVEKPWFGTYH